MNVNVRSLTLQGSETSTVSLIEKTKKEVIAETRNNYMMLVVTELQIIEGKGEIGILFKKIYKKIT